MAVDIEEILGRELREVADGLHVPARPPLPQDPPRISRHRHALLVAAVVVLIIASAVAMEMISRGERALDPAPPAPTPSRTDAPIPTATPTATYELNRKLYAGGRRVPGTWLWVTAAGDTWVAWRDDLTWWWGRDGRSHQI